MKLVCIFALTHITLHMAVNINPLNAELNPIRHLLALVGARHIVHVSRIRVKQELLLESVLFFGIIYIKVKKKSLSFNSPKEIACTRYFSTRLTATAYVLFSKSQAALCLDCYILQDWLDRWLWNVRSQPPTLPRIASHSKEVPTCTAEGKPEISHALSILFFAKFIFVIKTYFEVCIVVVFPHNLFLEHLLNMTWW